MHLHLITVNRENVFNHLKRIFYGIVCIFDHQTQPVGMNVWDHNRLRRTLQNGSVVRRGETDHRLTKYRENREIENILRSSPGVNTSGNRSPLLFVNGF